MFTIHLNTNWIYTIICISVMFDHLDNTTIALDLAFFFSIEG